MSEAGLCRARRADVRHRRAEATYAAGKRIHALLSVAAALAAFRSVCPPPPARHPCRPVEGQGHAAKHVRRERQEAAERQGAPAGQGVGRGEAALLGRRVGMAHGVWLLALHGAAERWSELQGEAHFTE